MLRFGRDHALVLGATFAFALMAVFTRGADAPVLTVAAWRAVFVALGFVAWAALAGGVFAGRSVRELAPDRATLRLGVGYGVALAVASSTFVGGYALTTVANTIFFHSLSPLAVFPLAWWLFRERPEARALAGTGVAVLGVALLSGASVLQFTSNVDPRYLLGDALAFVSALGYGAVLVATRAGRERELPVLPLLAVAWTTAALLLCGVALLFGTLALPLDALPWVLGLAVVCTNIPFYLLNVAMRRVPAGMTSLLSMAEVVFATLVGLVVFGEALPPVAWVGGALVALGIAYPLLPAGEGAAARGALSEASLPARWGRLGLRLLLFNGGAALVLLEGDEAGALLAWVALASVARLGRAPTLALLGPGLDGAVRAGAAALGGAVLLGVATRGGWETATPALGGALLAAFVAVADRALLRGERAEDQDADPLGAAALVAVAAGIGLAAVDHPWGPLALRAAAALTALASLATAAAAARGADPRDAALDHATLRVATPRRVAALAALVIATGGVRVVPPGHVAVIERLGAPLATPAPAGLLVRLPPPVERATLVDVASVRLVPLTGPDTALLTGDQALVTAQVTLYHTVADPLAYALRAGDPEASLAAIGRGAVAEVVARLPLDAVLAPGRRDVEARVAEAAQAAADRAGLGVRIEAVQVGKVAVPPAVQAAFLDVISAEEDKRGRVNGAEAYAAQVVPRARGEAVAVVEGAAGAAAARTAAADGRAAWIEGVARGGAPAGALTRTRVWRQRVGDALGARPLVLAPGSVRVWLGGVEAGAAPAPARPGAKGAGGATKGGGAPKAAGAATGKGG